MTLITAHNTKGLEFDRVMITGLEEGNLPPRIQHGRAPRTWRKSGGCSTSEPRGPGEQLVMTCCVRRRLFGRTTEMSPSRFLDEVPDGDGAGRRRARPRPRRSRFPVGSGVYHEEYGTGVVERTWYNDGRPCWCR